MIQPGSLVDCHIHVLTNGLDPKSGKYGNIIDQKLLASSVFSHTAKYHSIDLYDADSDRIYLDLLDRLIEESVYVREGIAFGMDGIYDRNGVLDREKTKIMITNDYAYDRLKEYPHLRFAASISPSRRDAIDELEKVVARNAALVKAIPNTQNFDAGDRRYIPFYRRMAELNIPLLLHAGYEFAVSVANQSYGNPARFRTALDEGVTVIAAHACASGFPIVQFHKKTVLELCESYSNFYLDLSALSLPTRSGIAPFLQKHETIKERLLYGTDFPLPVLSFPFLLPLKRSVIRNLKSVPNYFDRQALFLDEMGLLRPNDRLFC